MTDPRLIVMLERIMELPDGHRARENPIHLPARPVGPDDPIEDLALRPHTTKALAADGVRTVRDLIARTERDLCATPKLGRMRIGEIATALAAHALRLRENAPRRVPG